MYYMYLTYLQILCLFINL
ncbi:hypothetical protein Patl1_20453 [Pistacia atlantica]|uniref:Uncharacterized protein n=1 Tax=Pistacia atlantica TaxID=434234 RepID=A0ACC1BJY7_9ROSI|nr:hypothetical protein Patl1_20453 [Pistacia atlantica]